MKYLKLRIAWSVACSIACVLLGMLWVRSYQVCDIVFRVNANSIGTTFGSDWGAIYFLHVDQSKTFRYGPQPAPSGWKIDSVDPTATPRKFEWVITPGQWTVRVPHSLPIVGCITFGLAPWIRRRFSLLNLLIASTVVSCLLGFVIWSLGSE
jgi:hypothetical protein